MPGSHRIWATSDWPIEIRVHCKNQSSSIVTALGKNDQDTINLRAMARLSDVVRPSFEANRFKNRGRVRAAYNG